tara:strand:+ start:566 stop:988 length:423 start_codon:yes stop_codon:yes gene_type:complete
MSAIKFQVGEPKKLTLAFDEPKSGKNDYGKWYMYGFKNGDLSSEEDCFFATETLHSMIQTLGAKEGDEITIEKCQDLEMTFFKVNGLSINDMNSGGAIEKIEKAKPKNEEMEKLIAENKKLKEELEQLKDGKLSASDIPF